MERAAAAARRQGHKSNASNPFRPLFKWNVCCLMLFGRNDPFFDCYSPEFYTVIHLLTNAFQNFVPDVIFQLFR